ncbi:MAG: SDR family oxidoreductase [Phycisphaerales bacterium]|nr:SDR family oxidoreductase [Phycisphaerales bacterium]
MNAGNSGGGQTLTAAPSAFGPPSNPPVCIITGAGRGIGLAVARRFAKRGAGLVIVARSATELDEAQRELEACGGRVAAIPADLADRGAASSIVEAAMQRFGRIDVLVNNAGRVASAAADAMTDEEFDALVAINCGAMLRLVRSAWPILRAQGGGAIVNVSSIASADPFPGLGVYGATKAWVNTYTRALADEGRRFNIRAFAIAPAAVETVMLRSIAPDLPARQCLQPDEVAAVIENVSDPSWTPCSGQTIFVRK